MVKHCQGASYLTVVLHDLISSGDAANADGDPEGPGKLYLLWVLQTLGPALE